MFSCSNDNNKQQFKNTLTQEQQILYEKIIAERKKIYYGGFLLGIVLSFIALYFGNKFLFSSNSKSASMPKICMIASITFVTNYLFYILYPKTDYMLLHLNDKTQIQGWLAIYKKMQFKFHLGFILGIIAVTIYAYGFCK
jgi:multisubunit Na+/H+ antiporter MnhE subunit